MTAITDMDDGVLIEVHVIPSAKEVRIVGYNPWRDCVEVRLTEKPQKGRANKQLIEVFEKLFDVERKNIKIIKGLKTDSKVIKIDGVDGKRVREVFSDGSRRKTRKN